MSRSRELRFWRANRLEYTITLVAAVCAWAVLSAILVLVVFRVLQAIV